MDEFELDGTSTLRVKVLKGMSIGIGSLALLLAIGNVTIGQSYMLAFSELLYALYSWYLYKQIKNKTLKPWHKYIISAFITAIIVYGTSIEHAKWGIFVWTYVLPIIYYLLLGKKVGLIATIALFITQSSILFIILDPENRYYPIGTMINFTFSYLSVAAISHVYEANRFSTEQKLKSLATIDTLTQVNNRLALRHRFQELKKSQSPFYVMILDIDHFKRINDEFGHDAGDVVLTSVANKIAELAGNANVYRQGGEEFCVILEQADRKYVMSVAEKIRQSVSHSSVPFEEHDIDITVSIGISDTVKQNCLVEANRRADANLYRAKNSGRNAIVACG